MVKGCGNARPVHMLWMRCATGLKQECHGIMGKAEFQESIHCIECGQLVPVKPPMASDGEHTWIDIVSPACTSFSAFGSQLGVLDKSNIPLWVWGYMTRKHKPHTFVLENVPRFDQTLLAELLAPLLQVGEFARFTDAHWCPLDGQPAVHQRHHRSRRGHVPSVVLHGHVRDVSPHAHRRWRRLRGSFGFRAPSLARLLVRYEEDHTGS